MKNAIVLKDKEKSYKLIISTIAFYYTKGNEGLDILLLKMIYKMCNDSK
jgi:hypothetical protein